MSKVMETVVKRGITTIPQPPDDAHLAKLEWRYANMFGVEENARSQLGREIDKVKTLRALSGNAILDTRVLRWRWPQRERNWNTPSSAYHGVALPRVALVRIDDPLVCLSVYGNRGALRIKSGKEKNFPIVWEENLKDVRDDLRRSAGFDTVKLRFQWEGIIPDEARTTIGKAIERFGQDETFLLVESPAKSWKLDAPPRPAFIDPLIIGHKGGIFFYLGKFDPTKVENYIATEFMS